MSREVENERSKSRHLDKNDLKNTKWDAFFLKNASIFKSSDVRRFIRQRYTKYQIKRNDFQDIKCPKGRRGAVPYGNSLQNIRLKEMILKI